MIELMIKCRLCPVGSRPMKNKANALKESSWWTISNEERESTKKKTESFLQEGLIGMQLNACPLHPTHQMCQYLATYN